jgi:hypothetical protein
MRTRVRSEGFEHLLFRESISLTTVNNLKRMHRHVHIASPVRPHGRALRACAHAGMMISLLPNDEVLTSRILSDSIIRQ